MESYKTLSVLVVDDESFMRKILGHMLGQLGFTAITTLGSAEAALRLLDSYDAPQLVLLDINMPVMDGVEFIRSLVALGYTGSLILASGETERVLETVAKLAKAHGINVLGKIQKPVTAGALEALLSAWEPMPSWQLRRRQKIVYDSYTLRAAIADGQLVNYYQPKVMVHTGAFVGAEVLVRWRHPSDGLVYPDQFIPLAEECGMIQGLTQTVLRETLRQVCVWRDAGLQVQPAVNVSMHDLNVLHFPDDLARMADEYGVSMHDIVLEVTESQLIPNLTTVLDTLSRLSLKRVALAIDDFGTGHSSLVQLSDLPFNQLKIDKRFVHGAHANLTARTIFTASRAMGNQLGMEVVAEGVEDRADWDWLQEVGCDVAQGYFIASPMPAEVLPAWLRQWQQRILTENLLGSPQDPDGLWSA